jgi:hypothetical protein
VTSLYDVLERDVEWRIQEIIDNGVYHAPEPVMDLAFAKERMTIAYLEAQQDDLDLDKINMMIQFIEECDALTQSEAPEGEAPGGEAPAMPGMPPEGAPPGPPGMPPGMPPMPEGGPPLPI